MGKEVGGRDLRIFPSSTEKPYIPSGTARPQNSTLTCSCRDAWAESKADVAKGMAVSSKSGRGGAPARERMVGARSVWAVTMSVVEPLGTPGPRMMGGMWMSSSQPHVFPGGSRCWLL
jgi:hypothetical protein